MFGWKFICEKKERSKIIAVLTMNFKWDVVSIYSISPLVLVVLCGVLSNFNDARAPHSVRLQLQGLRQ